MLTPSVPIVLLTLPRSLPLPFLPLPFLPLPSVPLQFALFWSLSLRSLPARSVPLLLVLRAPSVVVPSLPPHALLPLVSPRFLLLFALLGAVLRGPLVLGGVGALGRVQVDDVHP
jgi:hypothetical protein